MSDLPRRRCAYAGNSNTNAQREYTCGAARAPTRKWRLDDWRPGVSGEPRERGGGGRGAEDYGPRGRKL